jgi:type I restriction enzyme, R subunit
MVGCQNARFEHHTALRQAITALVSDHTELFEHFMEDDGFRHFVTEAIFAETYRPTDITT